MLTQRVVLWMTWDLLHRGDLEWVCSRLGDVLPTLFLVDGRNKTYIAWTTRWWVKRIASLSLETSFDEFLRLHPELLNPALGERERWTEEEANKPFVKVT